MGDQRSHCRGYRQLHRIGHDPAPGQEPGCSDVADVDSYVDSYVDSHVDSHGYGDGHRNGNRSDVDDLDNAAQRISGFERALSVKRSEVHRLIDEVQEEIIGRYRSGSVSVDDLLKG